MSEVNIEMDMAAPVQAVFDVALDAERLGEWVTIHRELIRVDPGPPVAGMTMKQKMALRGAPFTVDWTLEKCTSPTHAKWVGKGPARSKALTEYTLSEIASGTRFAYRNSFTTPFGPLGAIAGNVLVGGTPEKEAVASLTRLKDLVEALHQK